MFLTVEGGEGAGKSTLIKGICSALKHLGREVVVTREPGGTPLGEHIRGWLLSSEFQGKITSQSELLLFLASRTQHIDEVIKPAINRGAVVICDRFTDSTVAYQGGARDLGIDYTEKLSLLACHDFIPDLTLFLDLSTDVGMSRLKGEKDRLESEPNSFHQKVRDAFHILAKRHPQRIRVLDASQCAEDVLSQALAVLDEKLSV